MLWDSYLKKGNHSIIVFDVDGPLTAFDEEVFKIIKPEITQKDILNNCQWDCFSLLNKEETIKTYKLLEDPLFWLNLPPKELSQEKIELVRKLGYRVLFCTSPWSNCKEWCFTRTNWLKKHFGASGRDDIIITGAKKYIYGDIFVDDKPSNTQEWSTMWRLDKRLKCEAFLYETLANKNDPIAIGLNRIVSNNKNWNILYE